MVVLAIVLLLLVVIFVPRPNVRLTDVRYQTSSCDPVTSTVIATAYVTFTNSGMLDGYIIARFYVDGERRATSGFPVAAQSTVEGTLVEPSRDALLIAIASTPVFRRQIPPDRARLDKKENHRRQNDLGATSSLRPLASH